MIQSPKGDRVAASGFQATLISHDPRRFASTPAHSPHSHCVRARALTLWLASLPTCLSPYLPLSLPASLPTCLSPYLPLSLLAPLPACRPHTRTAEGYFPCESSSVWDVYILCFYFAMTTLTTVGYGDLSLPLFHFISFNLFL